MEQEKIFNERESLQLIESMMLSAKKEIGEDGIMYLFWGWLVFVAALTNYFLQFVINYENYWLPWAVLMPLGGVFSFIYGARKGKQQKVKTFVSEFLGYLGIAFGVCLFIVLFFGYKLELNCYPMVMLVYGIWLFVSGGVLRFKPLIIGGIINWIFAIASFFVTFDLQLLFISSAVLLGYIIPGHMLNHQFRKHV
jgi:small basic protein